MLGFLISTLFVNGFVFSPLSAARKIILVGIGIFTLSILFDWYYSKWRFRLPALLTVSVVAFLWIFWPVLVAKEGFLLIGIAASGILYMIWHIVLSDMLRTDPLRIGSSMVALGIGTGAVAILGASALLGQMALSISAGVGAYLLIAVLFRNLPSGTLISWPAATISSLLGFGALLLADLSWITLLLLAPIPLVAKIPLPNHYPRWIQAGIVFMACLTMAGVAIFSAWYGSEEVVY